MFLSRVRLAVIHDSSQHGQGCCCTCWQPSSPALQMRHMHTSTTRAAGVPLTMVPIEVTHEAIVTPTVLAAMHGHDGDTAAPLPSSPFRACVGQLLMYFAATYRDMFHFMDGPPLHDPCAVAAVIDPSIFTVRAALRCTALHDHHLALPPTAQSAPARKH